MDTSSKLRNFLEIPYDNLEEMNLIASDKSDTLSSLALKKDYL